MTITIQVNEPNGTVTTAIPGTADSNSPGISATGAHDGGAPRVGSAAGGTSVSGGDVTDIGAPPQWLSDAISEKGDTSSSGVTAAGDSGNESGGQDGGTGPSF